MNQYLRSMDFPCLIKTNAIYYLQNAFCKYRSLNLKFLTSKRLENKWNLYYMHGRLFKPSKNEQRDGNCVTVCRKCL